MNQERIAALIEKLSEKFDANREHQDSQIEKLRQEQKEALLRLEEANKDRFNRVDRDLSEVKARVEKSDGDLASIRNELTGRNEGILERFATIETRLSNAEQSAKTNAETQASLRVAIERASDKIDALKEKTAHESGASGRDAKILWAVIVAIVAGVVSIFFNMSRNTFTVPANKGKTTPSIQKEHPKTQKTGDHTMITQEILAQLEQQAALQPRPEYDAEKAAWEEAKADKSRDLSTYPTIPTSHQTAEKNITLTLSNGSNITYQHNPDHPTRFGELNDQVLIVLNFRGLDPAGDPLWITRSYFISHILSVYAWKEEEEEKPQG